jgi:hypothetical protein
MGCFSNSAPSTPNYGNVLTQTVNAQAGLAPTQYALESQFQPLYGDLNLQTLYQMLYGTQGGQQDYSYNTTAAKKGWYDASGNLLAAGGANMKNAPSGATWHGKNTSFTANGSVNTQASPGMLQLQTGLRQADINDVANLGPQATQAMLNADPYNAQLLAKLNAQANQELDAGSSLTPDQQRAMQQESRAAFAARGMGGGNGAIADELLKQFNLGQQLLEQRQRFAQGLVGTNQQVVGDPFMQILGRNGSALQNSQQSMNGAGPSLFNPQAGLGLAESNYATQSQFAAAQPTMFGQIMNGFGAAGGLIGGIGQAMQGVAALDSRSHGPS